MAEAVLDGSTGSTGTFSGEFEIPETVGRLEGANLFHSFGTFRIRRGESATFTGSGGIDNVISRVTGDAISRINGRLTSTVPGANFFFLNPNGVVFGPRARIDVGGSFHVSSADELRFADGAALATRNPSASGFTAAPPEAFGFLGDDAGTITVNRSRLKVPPRETLSLVGGPIRIFGVRTNPFELKAEGGRIRLASAASPGEINVETGEDTTLQGFSIIISDRALVTTSGVGGGEIRASAGLFVVDREAKVFAGNTGVDASAGGIFIQAGGIIVDSEGNIAADAHSDGDAGRVDVQAEVIRLFDGGQISSSTFDAGNAGTVTVRADRLLIEGFNAEFDTSIISDARDGSTGNAGNVIVEADTSLRIHDGVVSSETFGTGDAGRVTVEAERLVLIGDPFATISSRSLERQSGAAGELNISATVIKILDGGQISSSTSSNERAGTVVLDAERLIVEGRDSGIFSQADRRSSGAAGAVIVSADVVELRQGGRISSGTFADDAGTVTVVAGRMELDGGDITSFTAGPGNAGPVVVRVDNELVLRRGGTISSDTSSAGSGGIVVVDAGTLRIAGPGGISSSSERRGPGGDAGNVLVTTGELVVDAGGFIRSRTRGGGRAGQVLVATDDGEVRGAIETTSLGTGDAGTIVLAGERFAIRDGGVVSSEGIGEGAAGNILLRTGSLTLDHGRITTEGARGGLVTTAEGSVQLIHLADSEVTTNGIEPVGGASIIRMGADEIVLNSSEVTSLTGGRPIVGSGEAGVEGDLTVISTDSRVAASSKVEVSGLESDVTAGLDVLPGIFLDVSGLLRATCATRRSEATSSLTETGRRGVAPGPDGFLPGAYTGLSGTTLTGAAMTESGFLELPAGCAS